MQHRCPSPSGQVEHSSVTHGGIKRWPDVQPVTPVYRPTSASCAVLAALASAAQAGEPPEHAAGSEGLGLLPWTCWPFPLGPPSPRTPLATSSVDSFAFPVVSAGSSRGSDVTVLSSSGDCPRQGSVGCACPGLRLVVLPCCPPSLSPHSPEAEAAACSTPGTPSCPNPAVKVGTAVSPCPSSNHVPAFSLKGPSVPLSFPTSPVSVL